MGQVHSSITKIQTRTNELGVQGGNQSTTKNHNQMDVLDCKVCNTPYDEEEYRPRNAPCGHDLCSSCIRALIKNNLFECPMCRRKNKVCVPDDLPVSFGLIDVIRAFKTQNTSLPKEDGYKNEGALKDEVCKVHQKKIGHRCLRCERWACIDCLDTHSTLTGCSTISSSTAITSMKAEHTENVDKLLTIFEEDTNMLLSKVQDHNDKIKEISDKKKLLSEQANKHAEEIEKIQNVIEQGTKQKKNVVESRNKLDFISSPHAVMDWIEVLEQMKLSLISWSRKNLGTDTKHGLSKVAKHTKIKEENGNVSLSKESLGVTNSPQATMTRGSQSLMNLGMDTVHSLLQVDKHSRITKENENMSLYKERLCVTNSPQTTMQRGSQSLVNLGTDTQLTLLQQLKDGKEVYGEIVIKGQKRYGKLYKRKKSIYINTLRIQTVADDSICIPFDDLQKLLPPSPSMVFLELCLEGTTKGKLMIRLHNNLPNIRENMFNIVTGRLGKTLAGIKLPSRDGDSVFNSNLPFNNIPVIPDDNAFSEILRWDVVGFFGGGYLKKIYFQLEENDWSGGKVIGSIVTGKDILQECYDDHNTSLCITECGLVVPEKELRGVAW